ncbi:MAG: hypothetical protein ACTS85_04005 [Arsenophonus sp. NC-PG7-MAG3]
MKYYELGLAAVDNESGAYHINIHSLLNYPRQFLETYSFMSDSLLLEIKSNAFILNLMEINVILLAIYGVVILRRLISSQE